MTNRMGTFEGLVRDFTQRPEVEALVLGGSRSKDNYDAASDYDLYVYLKTPMDAETRKTLLEPHFAYLEMNNQYWETEDDGMLQCGTDIDILYRNLDRTASQIEEVHPSNGYTTCLWENVQHGKVLYDPEGAYGRLQKKLEIPLPEILKAGIIRRNRELLSGKLCSYDRQIQKAVARQDLPSISHRTAAFLESYFDILFALNGMYHPGEKRMMEYLEGKDVLPKNFRKNLETLFLLQYQDGTGFLAMLDTLVQQLDQVLAEQGY